MRLSGITHIGADQLQHGNLRGAVDADRKDRPADAPADEKIALVRRDQAAGIAFIDHGQHRRPEKRENHLAAVGVPAQDQRERCLEPRVDGIGIMRQQDAAVAFVRRRETGVDLQFIFHEIPGAADDDPVPAAVDRFAGVADILPGALKPFQRPFGVRPMVVVAQDRVDAVDRPQPRQNGPDGIDFPGGISRMDEVAGAGDDIGLQAVRFLDHPGHKRGRNQGAEVDVAQMDDATAVECRRQVGDGNAVVVDAKPAAFDEYRVARQQRRGPAKAGQF